MTGTQAQTAYDNTQNSLQNQQGLLGALQGQNGIQNQSNVYNQLQGVVNGTGPNPAQAQLAQATAANTANQAALMAGQRGSAQNVGLIARQAAMQGGANQQQAAGQAATMQAQQSLNAMQNAGQIAGNQVANQIGQTNTNVQAQQNEQTNLLNAIAQQNNASVGMQSNINSANAGLIGATMGQQASIGSSMANSASSALMGGGAEGGTAENLPKLMADGGYTQVSAPGMMSPDTGGPLSAVGQWFNNISQIGQKQKKPQQSSSPTTTTGTAAPWETGGGMAGGPNDTMSNASPGMSGDGTDLTTMQAAEGGTVPCLLSPGEVKLSPKKVKEVAKTGKSPMAVGQTVPGTPKVPGAVNSYANDTVPSDEEEGTIIIPRHITKGKNPSWESLKFVHQELKKQGSRSKK